MTKPGKAVETEGTWLGNVQGKAVWHATINCHWTDVTCHVLYSCVYSPACTLHACTWQGQNCSCTFQEVKCLSDLKTVLGRTRKSNIHCTLRAWCVCHSNYHYSSIYVHTFSSVFVVPHLHIKQLLCQFGAWVAFYGFQALVKMFIAKSLTTSACEHLIICNHWNTAVKIKS